MPALIQFDITHVGPALGLTALTMLSRSLHKNLSFPLALWHVAWYLTAAVSFLTYAAQLLRGLTYPHLLSHDFHHPVHTNFFASAGIVASCLLRACPSSIYVPLAVEIFFWAFLVAHVALAIWHYGEWLVSPTASLRRVSPLYFMAVINFFTLSALAVHVGRPEVARYLLAIGAVFWGLVFFATFSFLSTSFSDGSAAPCPRLFLFLAPPSAAALSSILLAKNDSATLPDDRLRFFAAVAAFVFLLLLRLLPLIVRHKFSTASSWAYVFPLGNFATLVVELTGVYEGTFVVVLAGIAAVVAGVVGLVVSGLTVGAVAKGRWPRSKASCRVHVDWEEKGDEESVT